MLNLRNFHQMLYSLMPVKDYFKQFLNYSIAEGWWNTETCFKVDTTNQTFNEYMEHHHNVTKKNLTTTPVEEFWE